MGKAACVVAADSYHFNSFMHDDLVGGSCSKLLVDECGVAVSATFDRPTYTSTDSWNVLNAVWQMAYGQCMGTIDYGFIDQLACGGTSTEDMCGRSAHQVVNEMVYKAYPEEQRVYSIGMSCTSTTGCPTGAGAYSDGFSDFNSGSTTVWSGPMLGAGKINYEVNADGSFPQTGYGPPIAAPGYQFSFHLNTPDNIERAATRLGAAAHPETAAVVAAGFNTCKTTCP